MKKTLILTGGGTAGHVTPNLALIPYLKDDFDFYYIGGGGIEESLVAPRADISYSSISAPKLQRDKFFANFSLAFRLPEAVAEAKRLLEVIEPDIVFGKGGYVSFPVAIAAKNFCPVIIHESDRSLGLTNRLIKRRAAKVLSSFEIKGTTCTGSPIRKELYDGKANRIVYERVEGKPTLLVTGGSQGALSINECVTRHLDELTEMFNVIHLTGKGKPAAPPRKGYLPMEFTTNIADCYAACDVCLTRGGSNTLFELAALKIPALIVPLEKASRGDQLQNAEYFTEKHFAHTLKEGDLDDIIPALSRLMKDETIKPALASASIDGTERIANIIREAVLN